MINRLLSLFPGTRRDGDTLVLPEAARGFTRRQILLGLAVAPAVVAAAPKLWVPGERLVSLPPREMTLDAYSMLSLDSVEDEVHLTIERELAMIFGMEQQHQVAFSREPSTVLLAAKLRWPKAELLRPGDIVSVDTTMFDHRYRLRALFRVTEIVSHYGIGGGVRTEIRARGLADAAGNVATMSYEPEGRHR